MKQYLFCLFLIMTIILSGCSTNNRVTEKDLNGSEIIANHYNDLIYNFEKETDFHDFSGLSITTGGNTITIILSSNSKHLILSTKYDTVEEELISFKMMLDEAISISEQDFYIEKFNEVISNNNVDKEYSNYYDTNSNMNVFIYEFR